MLEEQVEREDEPGGEREVGGQQPGLAGFDRRHQVERGEMAIADWAEEVRRFYPVIKAFRLQGPAQPHWLSYPADALLMDGASPGSGQGYPLDWITPLCSHPRLIIAGGLTPENLSAALGLRPYAVDVSSGVEAAPGHKDPGKLERFLFANDDRPVLAPIEEIIDEARNGRMFILVDDEDRENEGDLVIPAQMATPAAINFMATHGRGLICLTLTSQRVEELGLDLMSQNNGTRHETAFTVSIEAREGVTTGISAADRARTIAVAIDPARSRHDIVTPGHIFPLMARDGGVLVRAGHTEAADDITRLAGLNPSGVICEIMNEDGSMARLPDLVAFAQRHGLKVLHGLWLSSLPELNRRQIDVTIALANKYPDVIESVTVGHTDVAGMSRMTLVVDADEHAVGQRHLQADGR